MKLCGGVVVDELGGEWCDVVVRVGFVGIVGVCVDVERDVERRRGERERDV